MRIARDGSATRRARAAASLVVALTLPAAGRADAIKYTAVDLGTLPGGASDTSANGLNNLGQVVGMSGGNAFVYSADGGMTSLGTQQSPVGITDSGVVGYSSDGFWGSAINASGEMVGSVPNPIGLSHPATEAGGVVTQLPGFGLGGAAIGINDSGQVSGYTIVVDPNTGLALEHPILYSGGKVTDLGLLPGATSAAAFGINNAGQVVGGQYGDPTGHAFL